MKQVLATLHRLPKSLYTSERQNNAHRKITHAGNLKCDMSLSFPKKETRALWIQFKQTFWTTDTPFRLKQKFLSGKIQWYFTRLFDEKDHLEAKVFDSKIFSQI